jgi:hypothetical protein
MSEGPQPQHEGTMASRVINRLQPPETPTVSANGYRSRRSNTGLFSADGWLALSRGL